MRELALVSGCDAAYFPLLRGLVRSLRASPTGREAPLYILDAGLAAEQRGWLAGQDARVAPPPAPTIAAAPGHVAMLFARPRIPELFPGHVIYMWIDADAWVQEDSAFAAYADGARVAGFCVAAERHPAYNLREMEAARRRILSWFGAEIAGALEGTVALNAGIFAGLADAPHWAAWRRRLDECVAAADREEAAFQADQVALNRMMYGDAPGCTILPAGFNWLCHAAAPMASADGSRLLDPSLPHPPLAAVHMTLWSKRGKPELATPKGGRIRRPLTYEAEPLPGEGKSLPDFAIKSLDAGRS